MGTVAPHDVGGPAVVEVSFDRIYGKLTCYPANDRAKLFAKIAGTRTLRASDLRAIRELGFELRTLQPNLLDSFIRSRPARDTYDPAGCLKRAGS